MQRKIKISGINAGKLVKAKRESLGWSQADLVRATGIDPGYISRLEGGRIPRVYPRNPLILLAELGYSLDDASEALGIARERPRAYDGIHKVEALSIDGVLENLRFIDSRLPFNDLVLDGAKAIAPENQLVLRQRDDLIERLVGELSEHPDPGRYAGKLCSLLVTAHWNAGPEYLFKKSLSRASEIILTNPPEDPDEDFVILCMQHAQVLRSTGHELEAQRWFARATPWTYKLKSDLGRDLLLYFAEDLMRPGGLTPEHFDDQLHGSLEDKRIQRSALLRCFACRVLRKIDPAAAYGTLDEAAAEMGPVASLSPEATYNRLYLDAIRLMLDWQLGNTTADQAENRAGELVSRVEAAATEERPLIAVLKYLQLRVMTTRAGPKEPIDRKHERLKLAIAIDNHLRVSVSAFCVADLELARSLALTTRTELES